LLIDARKLGEISTGDSAAASHILKAFVKFAQLLYSPKITDWAFPYDGRRAEPNNLPVNFHCLLLEKELLLTFPRKCCHIIYNELIDASMYPERKPFQIYPGFYDCRSDVSNYNDGMRGGRVRGRAKITLGQKYFGLPKSVFYKYDYFD
jgi:topoisomerase-4 subunit A